MAGEVTKTYVFNGDSGGGTAWGPGHPTLAFPAGYTLGGDRARVSAGTFVKFASGESNNTVILDDTPLTGQIIASEILLSGVGSATQGCSLCSPTGNGYMFLVNNTNIRVYTMVNFALGVLVGTINFVVSSNHRFRAVRDNANPGTMTMYSGPVNPQDGEFLARGTVNHVNANTDWRAGAFVRGTAAVKSLTSIYTANQKVDSLTDPLIAGGAFTGKSSNFNNGNAIFTIAEKAIPITINNAAEGAFGAVLTGMQDNTDYPFLPSTALTGTITQGAFSASFSRTIGLPTNWETLRDEFNAPATFFDLISSDSTGLAFHFAQAGNALTTADRMYWDASTGLMFSRDSMPDIPVAAAPLITTVIIHRANGKTFFHEVQINKAGGVVKVSTGFRANYFKAKKYAARSF